MTPFYDRDGITIYHGDCLEILPTLGPVDCVITDPPYGILDHGGKWGHKAALHWDSKPADFVVDIVKEVGSGIVWGGNYFALPPSRGWVVWHKRDAVPSASPVELAWTSLDCNSVYIDHPIAAANAERVGHPTQKPLRVMRICLGMLPNGTILDPFMGSGTTLVAARLEGRRAIGIELEEKWCQVAVDRLEHGDKGAAKIASGMTPFAWEVS